MVLRKRFYSILLINLLIISCSKQREPAFSLHVSLNNKTVPYLVLRQESDLERKISRVIDTIYPDIDGKFHASYDEEPHLYSLRVVEKRNIPLAINKGQQLFLTVNDTDYTIEGSEDSRLLKSYETYRKKSLDSLVNSVRKKLKQLKKDNNANQYLLDSLGRLEVFNYKKHLLDLNDFVKNNMKGTIGLYATSIRWKGENNLAFFDSLVTDFESIYPELSVTKKLREKVKRLQQTSVGGMVAEIEMTNANKDIILLSSINKKYTLIDFWASWCGPCRRESESLYELYMKYKPLGFEIYNVSLDSDNDKWLNAVEKDNRIWTNVTSLEAFKTPAAYDYAVTSLPANYLVDYSGKILAKNIHGKELEDLLTMLFN